MKVFIWVDPYTVNYGSSLFFAVAETVEQARELAKTATPCTFGTEDTRSAGEWRSKIVLGEPHRIVNIPCAEWHEWSE